MKKKILAAVAAVIVAVAGYLYVDYNYVILNLDEQAELLGQVQFLRQQAFEYGKSLCNKGS
jgi:hypothetical protein